MARAMGRKKTLVRWIEVEDVGYRVDRANDLERARAAMRDAGIKSARVNAGPVLGAGTPIAETIYAEVPTPDSATLSVLNYLRAKAAVIESRRLGPNDPAEWDLENAAKAEVLLDVADEIEAGLHSPRGLTS